MKRAIAIVLLVAGLVFVPAVAAEGEEPIEGTPTVESIEDVDEASVEEADILPVEDVEAPVDEELPEEGGFLGDLWGDLMSYLGENFLEIVFVVGSVYMLRFTGFIGTGAQKRWAVVVAAAAAAGLGTLPEVYPEAGQWLEVVEKIYGLIVASPILHRIIEAAVKEGQKRATEFSAKKVA